VFASDFPALDLVDEIPTAVVVTNASGEIIRVNRAAVDLLGRVPHQLLGRSLAAFIELIQTGPDDAGPQRGKVRRPDGAARVVEARGRVLADGRTLQTLHDVTDATASQEAMRASVAQLLFVSDAVPALLAYIDTDERYVWVNEAYRRWFAQAPEAIRGRHPSDVLGPEAWQKLKPLAAKALAGEQVEFDTYLIYKNGPPRHVHAVYIPHRDADGAVRGFISLVTDASDARRAESALRRSERLLVESQAAAHVGTWEATFSENGPQAPASLWWSDEAFRMFGWELGTQPDYARFLSAVHPDDREELREVTRLGLERGGRFEKEYRIVLPDGTIRSIQAWTTVEKHPSGRVMRLLGTCQDVTDRLFQAREREQTLEDLKEADRRKDEFLAMLSHELRNPLAPILSAVEILKLVDPRETETSARYRNVIEQQVHLMKRLLDDLLDVARVSQGKIELRREVLDLGTVLTRAIEVSRPLISEKNQSLTVSTRPQAILVDADATRLVQVFANLLNNASKYSEHGGRVELDYGIEDGHAFVRVRDNGVGMNADLLERAFDLFVQDSRSLDRAQGGLGIGLTMVRSLVQMHGGSVRAFSEGPGRGTEVVVQLPRVAGPARSDRRSGSHTLATADRPLRVLVVDDNLDAARTLGDLLRFLGHQVAIANDGPTALAAAATTPPELFLIDIGLPGMDGYQLAGALRAAGHRMASLVAVTGYGRDDDMRRSRDAGFDHHLVKPVDLTALQRITLARSRAPAPPTRS
jgi:two-component system CheB/CheR fusion protein